MGPRYPLFLPRLANGRSCKADLEKPQHPLEKLLAPAVASSRSPFYSEARWLFDVDARNGVKLQPPPTFNPSTHFLGIPSGSIHPTYSINMANIFEQSGNGQLFLGGQKISGTDIRDQNGEPPGTVCAGVGDTITDYNHQSSQPRPLQMLSRAPSALAASTR